MQRKSLYEAMMERVAQSKPAFSRPILSRQPFPSQDGPPKRDSSIQGLMDPVTEARHERDDGDD